MRASPRHPLYRTLALRLLFGAISILFISLVTFLADELSPGDIALVRAGERATAQQVERIREELGLNRPWYVRYVEFLGNAAKGDFGTSSYGTREPVADILKRTLPLTARIAVMAILLAAIIGITLGTIAAVYENRALDKLSLSVSTLGVTIPTFVLAPLLVYVFAIQMDRLPVSYTTQQVAPEIYYLILPVIVLAARPMAVLTRLTRASMIDTLQQEFIRLAKAKGLPGWKIVWHHALRNAILPVVTVIGTSFGFLLTGSFVVETIFTIPGIGHETINAIQKGDTPVILAAVMVTGALFVVVNLLVDLVLPFIDPRIQELKA